MISIFKKIYEERYRSIIFFVFFAFFYNILSYGFGFRSNLELKHIFLVVFGWFSGYFIAHLIGFTYRSMKKNRQ